MFKSLAIAIFAFIAFLCSPIEQAYADQTFVCDDGTSVTVKSRNLEFAKRTMSCVAQYFGLKVALRPKMVRRQGRLSDSAKHNAPVRMQKLADHAQLVLDAHQPIRERVQTSAGSDFRNVRIINAKPGRANVFRHWR